MFTRNYFILPWISRSVCIPKTYFTFFKNSFWFEYISLICRVISVWFTKLPRDHRSYQVKSFVLFLLSNFNESDSFCRDNISLCFAVFYWSIFNTCILGGSQISFLVLIIPCRPMPMFLISNLFCLVLKKCQWDCFLLHFCLFVLEFTYPIFVLSDMQQLLHVKILLWFFKSFVKKVDTTFNIHAFSHFLLPIKFISFCVIRSQASTLSSLSD